MQLALNGTDNNMTNARTATPTPSLYHVHVTCETERGDTQEITIPCDTYSDAIALRNKWNALPLTTATVSGYAAYLATFPRYCVFIYRIDNGKTVDYVPYDNIADAKIAAEKWMRHFNVVATVHDGYAYRAR